MEKFCFLSFKEAVFQGLSPRNFFNIHDLDNHISVLNLLFTGKFIKNRVARHFKHDIMFSDFFNPYKYGFQLTLKTAVLKANF